MNKNFESIFKEIKNLLYLGANNRKHSFHTPTFSNISKKMTLESRIVVLRKFDEEKLFLNFHTDFRSPKILDLKKNNNSSFLFYDHSIKIQLRIKTISSINNQNEIAKQSWDLTQLSSRKCYLTKKRPSSKTNIPEDGLPKHLQGIDPIKNESEGGYNNFAVIQNKIESIDWLYLSYSGHKRLSINFKNNIPEFSWLIP